MGGPGSGGQNKIYSPEVAEKIVNLALAGKTLTEIAEIIGVSMGTINRWMLQDGQFESQFTRARQIATHSEVDDLKKIAVEEQDVNRARIRIDLGKWIASKRYAQVYGDRLDLNVNQTIDLGGALLEANQRALLPRRDLGNIEDAQLVETKQLTDKRSTGSEPVATEEEDIFS